MSRAAPARPQLDVGHLDALRCHADRPALRTDDGVTSYAELADRVTAAVRELGEVRRLLLLQTGNDVDSVVAWLAAWIGGHVAVLVRADETPDALVARFGPDLHLVRGRAVAHGPSSAALHPDLALLLPTSGSTGRPKLVRLGGAGLHANAHAIAAALGLGPTDVAALNLPLAHAYGLSVLHSHLAVGATVWLTERTVVDPRFAERFDAFGATTLPGVPHTFDLLDSVRFFERPHPSLRLVTQAGGRLPADRVAALARRGARQGWSFVVMYGQTEATARITTLAPELADRHPSTVGRPVPGVTVRLDESAGGAPGVGEILVEGPSVMLGYAEGPEDLARGAEVAVLRTGDLGRWTDAGLLELVGRMGRTVKPFGYRVDLDGLEARLRDAGFRAAATGGDADLAVLVEACDDPRAVAALTAAWARVPARIVRVRAVPSLPRLPSGKLDGEAVRRLLAPAVHAGSGAVAALYRDVLGVHDLAPTDTFVSLGGDSLTYVAIATRLAERLHPLPPDWPEIPVAELERLAVGPAASDGVPPTETVVLLRAAGILLVTASHAGLVGAGGGAHLLLLVAGYQFARFHVTAASRHDRFVHLGRSLVRWVVPTGAWLATLALLDPRYGPEVVFATHPSTPPDDPAWRFWFVETLLYLQVIVGVGLFLTDRLERRAPFPFALAVTLLGGVALLAIGQRLPNATFMPWGTLWLFGLGWAVQRADEPVRRVGVGVLLAVLGLGVFGLGVRGGALVLGGLLLLAVPGVRLPRAVARPVAIVADASLATYLVHFSVLDRLPPGSPLAWPLAIGAGVAAAAVVRAVGRALGTRAGR